jgi:hypothetical protein
VSKAMGLAAVACLLGAALPTSAAAQVEFTPFFASYYALANTTDDFAGTGLEERQVSAPAVGGRLTFWLGSSFGIEGAGSFALSGTRFTSDDPSDNAGVSLSGTLITGSGRLLYRPARTNLHFLIGGGVVSRGGDSWDGFDGKTDIAGVAGFGVRAAVTPKFALNVNVEGFVYSMNPSSTFLTYDSKLQADIYVVIGVPISFGG